MGDVLYVAQKIGRPKAAYLSTMPTILAAGHSHFGCIAALALTVLVARWIGIVSAAWRVISTGGSSTDGSSTDAYRHSTAYGCTTVDTTAIDTAVIDTAVIATTVMNATATTAKCEGVS